MASDPHGWPDPARPGYPANPERSGWHWLKHPEDLRPFPSAWNAELGGWPSGALHSPQGIIDLGFTYLAPCLPPAEVAEALAQARREGMEAAARIGRHAVIPSTGSALTVMEARHAICAAIDSAATGEAGE